MVMLGMFGGPEVIIIAVVILLLFGGKKIPELMSGLGKGIRSFKDVTKDTDIKNDIKDIGKEVKDAADAVNNISKEAKTVTKPFKK
jgi:sec-independent protein translocase protein TatA